MGCKFHRSYFVHSLALNFALLRGKLRVETGVGVKHKYHPLIPLWLTAHISVFPECPFSSVRSRDIKGKTSVKSIVDQSPVLGLSAHPLNNPSHSRNKAKHIRPTKPTSLTPPT